MIFEKIDNVTKTIVPIDSLYYEDDREYRSKAGKCVREAVDTLRKMGIKVVGVLPLLASGSFTAQLSSC
jgi:hypothetical protein